MRTLRRGYFRAAGFRVVAAGSVAVCMGMFCAAAQAQTPVPAQTTAKPDSAAPQREADPYPSSLDFGSTSSVQRFSSSARARIAIGLATSSVTGA